MCISGSGKYLQQASESTRVKVYQDDASLPRYIFQVVPACFTFTLPSGCAKKFWPVPNVILHGLPCHPDAQRRQCFAAFQTSSYVSYLVIRMHKEDVVLQRFTCHPTCLTSSSGFTKKTLFCRIPNVILRVLPRHPDAKKKTLFCRIPNVLLRVLPRHPDAQRRCCFAVFQMSSYVSYLVIRMHKEDVVLPHSKCHSTCLTQSSGCEKTMFCRGPNVILCVLPRHRDTQRRQCLLRSKCHPTCLTSSSRFTKKTLFCRVPNVILRVLPSHPDAKRDVLPWSKCHPTCLPSSSECTKKTLFCRVPNVILRVLPRHPDAQRRRCFAAVLSV